MQRKLIFLAYFFICTVAAAQQYSFTYYTPKDCLVTDLNVESEDEICQGLGCPTVSHGFLVELDIILKLSKKPMLLWIVN